MNHIVISLTVCNITEDEAHYFKKKHSASYFKAKRNPVKSYTTKQTKKYCFAKKYFGKK